MHDLRGGHYIVRTIIHCKHLTFRLNKSKKVFTLNRIEKNNEKNIYTNLRKRPLGEKKENMLYELES